MSATRDLPIKDETTGPARDEGRGDRSQPLVRVRAATRADIPALASFINAAFAIETFLEGTRTNPEQLEAMMEAGTVLTAEDAEGRLLGSVYTEHRGNRAYMGMLAVDPAHQGKGLARLLLRACEERYRGLGCEAIYISVLNLRPELLRIYRRYGFAETGTEEFHTGQAAKPGVKCHCVVMSKNL